MLKNEGKKLYVLNERLIVLDSDVRSSHIRLVQGLDSFEFFEADLQLLFDEKHSEW